MKPQLRWARQSWRIHIICYKSHSLSAETSVEEMQLRVALASTRSSAAGAREVGGWVESPHGGRGSEHYSSVELTLGQQAVN